MTGCNMLVVLEDRRMQHMLSVTLLTNNHDPWLCGLKVYNSPHPHN